MRRGRVKHNPEFLKIVERAKQRIQECTVADVKAKLDRGEPIRFLDVREDHEFAKDHAKGARSLSEISKGLSLISRRRSSSIAEADTGLRWRRRACSRWAIAM
jgi:hypothetical protein